MKRIGIVSYNIYGNFTNYGSALQSWALYQTIKKIGNYHPVLIDYCPDVLTDCNPLNPFKNMWDQDIESKRMVEMTMPAIHENYYKFEEFYTKRFDKTITKYTSSNFENVVRQEKLDGFICGSDTIFCIDEFKGFDDGYYANYECMRGNSVSYAASFGDSHFDKGSYKILNERLQNFRAIGLREMQMLPYVREHTIVPSARTIDPTLLLTKSEYDTLAVQRLENEKYLFLYTRRYNPAMEVYAKKLANKNGWKIVEISLRATNAEKGHRMYYEAGVEEFLSLVKHAEFVVTNSFHGLIFAVQYSRPFCTFLREQADTKMTEVLKLFDLSTHMKISEKEMDIEEIDYKNVHKRISIARKQSIDFLKQALEILCNRNNGE